MNAAWIRRAGEADMSNALLDNVSSHRAHTACGFVETERVVHFRKRPG